MVLLYGSYIIYGYCTNYTKEGNDIINESIRFCYKTLELVSLLLHVNMIVAIGKGDYQREIYSIWAKPDWLDFCRFD